MATLGLKAIKRKHLIAQKVKNFLQVTKRLPTARISNGPSGVGLVTTARVKVHLNKKLKNNPLIKKLRFLIGDKNLILY